MQPTNFRVILPLILPLLVGCGAKTGLLMPDADVEPDAEVEPPPDCIDIDPGTLHASLDLMVTTRLLSADVFFLVDCTASMREEINNIRRGLAGTIVPGAMEVIPDVRFGVGAFGDFAVEGHGDFGDRPYELRRAVTDDIAAVQAAIDDLPRWIGGDDAEAQTEALYQTATGEGFSGFIDAAPGCPQRGVGYPCFREGSQPVVMMITDAPFHNGPGGSEPYLGIVPPPHSFDDAATALTDLGARVVGIDSGEAREDLEAIARRTGAVNELGEPLVYSISRAGEGITEEIVRGIESLALRVPVDVDGIVLDVPGDDLDATILVQRLVAVRADPPGGVDRIEDDVFYGVTPGTELYYDLEVRVDVIPTPLTTRLYPILVRFRANRVSVLMERLIYIEVPGLDGAEGCETADF